MSINKNTNQSGNIFTVLIGAVALVGVVSLASMNMLSGPVATSSRVMQKTMADSQIFSNNKIIILSATNQANGGDCEATPDSFIEPSPWRDATGNGPDGVTGSQGGGFVPNTLGLTTTDPWGTEYGYCVWDVGTVNDAGCGGATQLRLAGSPTPTAGNTDTQYVMALISAGQDRIFQTQCKDYDLVTPTNPILIGGGDDIIQPYTYNDATAAGGGLWSIDTGNTTMATIDKAVKFADQTDATITCDAASVNAMRYNAITNAIEKCNGVAGTWSDVGGGAFTLNTTPTPNVVSNNGDYDLDDFVFGSPQLADDGNTNHDRRMFFDKSKGAFRAGTAESDEWNDANVGNHSVAMGRRVIASGYTSFAAGNDSRALGQASVAMGRNNRADAFYSVALGREARVTSTGANSFAFGLGNATGTYPQVSGGNSFGIFMGDQSGVDVTSTNTMALLGGDFVVGSPQLADDGNTAHDARMFFDKSKAAFRAGRVTDAQWDDGSIGNNSVGVGYRTTASGSSGVAMGYQATASGNYSVSAGFNTTASGVASVAMGGGNASGNNSIAMGTNITASGNNSIVIGQTALATGTYSFALGLGFAPSNFPKVSGNNSFGIFMGNQSGVDIITPNVMSIMGGTLGVGTVAPTAGYKMDIVGDLRVQGSSTTCTIGNGTGATNCTSDERLKTEIKEIPNALDKIAQLNGVTFKWKDKSKDQKTNIGVIAQNIEKTFPEIVTEMPDGMKAVDYAALVSPLIEATKELKVRNEKLAQEVEKLKAYTGYKNDKTSFANWAIFGFIAGILALFGFMHLRQKPFK